MAFYRIDIHDPDCDISAERFFALVFRLFNYRGSMRQELQIEQENNAPDDPVTATQPMALTSSNSTASDGERERWVTPEEMKALYPDLCG